MSLVESPLSKKRKITFKTSIEARFRPMSAMNSYAARGEATDVQKHSDAAQVVDVRQSDSCSR